MGPPTASGWLDVHRHFWLPQSPSEVQAPMLKACSLKFVVKEPYIWDIPSVLAFNERCNVQIQILSSIPTNHAVPRSSNDFGAAFIASRPTRFGHLAALPTDDPAACLNEITRRATSCIIPPDGFAFNTCYNNRSLADPQL